MTSKLKLLVTSALSTVALLGVNPAFAADLGTDAGTDIDNTVTVNFNVGGTAQTAETGSDSFKVDRKVNLLVSETGNGNTVVAPDASQQAVSFTVRNLTNDTLDFLLSVEQPTSDDFNVEPTPAVKYYLDDGDGVFDAGDTLITYIDNLAEDASVVIHVVADIPNGLVTGDLAELILSAQAADKGAGAGTGVQGSALTDDSGDVDDKTEVQNVFADGDGDGAEGDNDGSHSALDTYEVAAADISAFKTSTVISDPVSGTTNPKAIPGAVVEYCISVNNAAGSATATNVALSDILPSTVTFVAGSIRVDGTVTSPGTSQTCSGGTAKTDTVGDDEGELDGSTVKATLADILENTGSALIFRVTVN